MSNNLPTFKCPNCGGVAVICDPISWPLESPFYNTDVVNVAVCTNRDCVATNARVAADPTNQYAACFDVSLAGLTVTFPAE